MREIVQIEPADPPAVPDGSREGLDAMYDKVPQVTCHCDRPGQCCELTAEEMEDDWATMYPLYTFEYLNIVDHLRKHFSPEDQARLTSITEERPRRCPFLEDGGGCAIYESRPLACRTYGVLTREMVEQTSKTYRGEVPEVWVHQFLRNERCTVCPHTTIDEPEKVDAHAREMVSFAYERELMEQGQAFDGLDDDRRRIVQEATGRDRLVRWTWGGFNALYGAAPAAQVVDSLKRSHLAE